MTQPTLTSDQLRRYHAGEDLEYILGKGDAPAKPQRRRRVQRPEAMLQAHVIQALAIASPRCVYLHVQNEGKRTGWERSMLRRMGVVPGAADLLFLWGSGCGAIELKAEGGRQTPAQKRFEGWCSEHGVRYVVCSSVDDVLETLREWGVLR